MGDVKLLGYDYSPFSSRAVLALKLKGVEYEFIREDFHNKGPRLLKYNPIYKKIPILLHNDKPILESLMIVEYVDETFPGPPLLPQDPYEKAQARFWAKFADEKCLGILWKSIWSKGEEQEKAQREGHELLKILDNQLKDKKFFGGDNVNLADIGANFVAYWFPVLEDVSGIKILTEEKYPSLSRWVNEYVNHSIIKESLPPRNELIAFFRGRWTAKPN